MPVIVDTSNLNAFCKKIAATPGLGVKAWDVMLYEVGKILESCVRLTTREKVDKIRRSIAFKNRTLNEKGSRTPILYFTKAGLGWFLDAPGEGYEGVAKGRKIGGKTFHPTTEFFHYGNPRWARYQSFLAQLKDKQIDVREVIGRAGKSWVQMADDAGIALTGIPGYVRNARPFKGNTKVHGFAAQSRGLWLKMTNQHSLLLGTIDGNRILQTSINGRYKYFLKNMEHAVFEDVKTVARAYPALIAA